jgi:hypothetical protein
MQVKARHTYHVEMGHLVCYAYLLSRSMLTYSNIVFAAETLRVLDGRKGNGRFQKIFNMK